MCFKYTCKSCHKATRFYCRHADWNQVNPECERPAIDPTPHINRKKCHTCQLIGGVIRELQNLVFQQPWLETEGVAGAENRPAWERDLSSEKSGETSGRNNSEEEVKN